MIKRLMILSLLLVSMISKSWAYSFINGFCEYEVISEEEQTVRLICFVDPYNMSSDTDIALSRFVTDESTNITYQLTEIKNNWSYFPHNPKLGTLTIPVSVNKIEGISSIEFSSLIVAEGNPVYDSRNNCNAIIETATNGLIFGCKNTAIPSSVTSIGDNAFSYCSGLTSISIPSSVTSIGSWAFYGCSGLTGISIPSSVTYIGGFAFSDCSGLAAITVAAGNPVYDSRNNCNAIIETATNGLIFGCKNTAIPSSVTSIGDNAFRYCSGLTGISIPSSVTSIGSWAFSGCSGLTSVSIPSSVTSIGRGAFSGCSGLTTITVDAGNPVYDSRNNCNAIIETATNELISGCKNTAIPSSVTSIGDLAFDGCSGLTGISIPSSVTSIGDLAFYGCSGLTSVSIPSSVTSIGESAFDGCSGLTGISIPSSVTSIGNYAFYGCSGLTSVTCKSSTPLSIGEYVFSNRANATLYVPAGSKAAYEAASVWNEFKEIIEIENITFADSKVKEICVANWDVNKDGELSYAEAAAVTSIGQVFYGNKEITSFNELQYFTGLTSIGSWAFYGCFGLTSIVIPGSVTYIGGFAFSDCSGLTSISIPSSVTSIGDYAFNSCSGLAAITVAADNPVYDSRNNCNAIIETATNELISGCKNTVIPSSVTSIGAGAFSGCSSLTSISIPSSVTSIFLQAFNGCSGLTSVSIPSSVTSIGDQAFIRCTGLTGISIPSSVISIGDEAFGSSGLATITVEAGNPVYDSRNNCNAIIKTATNELIIGCKNTVIPSSVTSIGDYAFRNCFGLTSIVIPGSVTSIGHGVFDSCSSLTNVSIPGSVTTIGDFAFNFCVALTSVTCKSSTPPSLGESVFSGTPTSTLYVPAGSKATYEAASVWNEFKEIIEIENITFADSKVKEICVANWDTNGDGKLSYAEAAAVTSIGQVFYGNKEITSFNELQYFTGLTSIGGQAFYGCTSLTSIVIPGSVASIGGEAFYYCSGLATITVDAGNPVYDSRNNCNAIIETATNELISGCKNTVIPSSVTSIGANAFYYCSGLTSISIPSSVTSIGPYAFCGCSGLTTITVDADNPVYDSRNNCNAIIETATNELIIGCKKTVIPSSVTSIGSSAFSGCSGLTGISIPSSVTSMGNSAFSGCTALTSISIPSSVTSIGGWAFNGCSGLTTITVDAGNPVFDSRNNCNAIIETSTNKLLYGCKNTVIPSSVTNIGGFAFEGCSSLTSIVIPGSVTSIGNYAFSGCSGLTGISIPSSVTSIGMEVFRGCSGLTSIVIPSSVTSIGYLAFGYCSSLTSVTCKSSTPPSLGEHVFFGTPTSTLYVPAGSKAAYEAASIWNEFKEIIEIENITFADSKVKEICVANWDTDGDGELSYAEAAAVTSIGQVFYGNSEITFFNELQYFTGLTSIGNQAFLRCSGLTSISIPSSVTSIGNYAFDGCSGLTSISIPSSVTSIGDEAFYHCSGLTSVSIPSSVTSIGNFAFYGCTGLTGISISSSVTSIGDDAFSGCSGLATITVEAGNPVYDSRNNCNAIIETATNELISGCKNTVIPSSVTSIDDYAFEGCSGLTSIVIPGSVTSIGSGAFYVCSGLTSVTCKSSIPPSLGGRYVFFGTPTSTLYVPAGSKAAYEEASVWNEFKEIVPIATVTISKYGSGTYCSPYALDFTNVSGMKAYVAAGYNTTTNTVYMLSVKTAQPGEGLFIKGAPGDYVVPEIETSTDNYLNLLVGTTNEVTVNTLSDDGKYTNYAYSLNKGTDAPAFYKYSDGSKCKAYKAYLQIPTSWLPTMSEAKTVKLVFDDEEPTGIEEFRTEKDVDDVKIYDMQGRRVAKPGKGLYIVNGKKVVFK